MEFHRKDDVSFTEMLGFLVKYLVLFDTSSLYKGKQVLAKLEDGDLYDNCEKKTIDITDYNSFISKLIKPIYYINVLLIYINPSSEQSLSLYTELLSLSNISSIILSSLINFSNSDL